MMLIENFAEYEPYWISITSLSSQLSESKFGARQPEYLQPVYRYAEYNYRDRFGQRNWKWIKKWWGIHPLFWIMAYFEGSTL